MLVEEGQEIAEEEPTTDGGSRVSVVWDDDDAFDDLIVESYREVRTVRGAGYSLEN